MSRRSTIFALLLLCCVASGTLTARAGQWIDDEESFEDSYAAGGSYIVDHFNETQLTGRFPRTGNPFRAEALATAVPIAYSTVLDAIMTALASGPGVESLSKQEDVDLDSAWASRLALDDPLASDAKAEWQNTLTHAGIRIEGISAAQIKTNIYNRVPGRNGYSQAKFLILDGMQMYGKPCTVLASYRTDHAMQWGLRSIHNPFSVRYEMRLFHVATVTESQTLESLAHSLGVKYSPVLIPYASSWYDDAMMWIEFGKACAEQPQ